MYGTAEYATSRVDAGTSNAFDDSGAAAVDQTLPTCLSSLQPDPDVDEERRVVASSPLKNPPTAKRVFCEESITEV